MDGCPEGNDPPCAYESPKESNGTNESNVEIMTRSSDVMY